MENYNSKKSNDLMWSSNETFISAQQLFDLVTYKASELIKSIAVRTFVPMEQDGVKVFHTLRLTSGLIVAQRHRKFGKCHSITIPRQYKVAGIYYIKFQL